MLCMKCKYYERTDRPGHYGVMLSWRGKLYRRFTYTDGLTLKSEQYAVRLSERINADIEERGKNFRPQDWFGIKEKGFRFNTYIENWRAKQTHLAPLLM